MEPNMQKLYLWPVFAQYRHRGIPDADISSLPKAPDYVMALMISTIVHAPSTCTPEGVFASIMLDPKISEDGAKCDVDIGQKLMTLPTQSNPSIPHSYNMTEHPLASAQRSNLHSGSLDPNSPLAIHLSHGLAYTTGSALGSFPPSLDACLTAFLAPNKVGLTAGARAWSKHAHRSRGDTPGSAGWWGRASGPVAVINEKALALFWKVMNAASWRNLHWLPHRVLVYEVRVPDGYGMRWSQDQSKYMDDEGVLKPGSSHELENQPWTFRGFVEPMMENGHDKGWRH